MPYQKYSNEIDRYNLKPGVHLQRAENQEFIKSWVIYRQVNEDFAQSFDDTKKDLAGVNVCFWIEEKEKRIGGLVMLPNGIGDFFLIPPENDTNRVLALIMPLLEAWSDTQKEIRAQVIATHHLDAFLANGFVLRESRYWMIKSTDKQTANWSSEWILSPLTPEKSEEIAALFEEAFAGAVGQYGTRDYDQHLASVNQYFSEFDPESEYGQASALVIEKASGQLAGACLVEKHKNIPTIRFVAVAPKYQRHGLATNLLVHATSVLEHTHDWIKLAVTEGNPAVDVYRNLGFVTGDTLHELYKPAAN